MSEALVVQKPLWLSEKDLAERWLTSVYTVQRERKSGRLKAKLIGGRWKYREDWVRQYEDEDTPCRKNSGSDNTFSIGAATAQTGASAGSIQELDRREAG